MGRMKNMKQVSLLGLSSVASICVFSACWALLLDGSVSRHVTGLLDLLSDVLKEDVMRYLEQRQMELVDTITTMVKVLAVVSSSFSCFNLMALASISIKHRLAHWLMFPHILTSCLSTIFVFLLPHLHAQDPASGVRRPRLPRSNHGGQKEVRLTSVEEHCARHRDRPGFPG